MESHNFKLTNRELASHGVRLLSPIEQRPSYDEDEREEENDFKKLGESLNKLQEARPSVTPSTAKLMQKASQNPSKAFPRLTTSTTSKQTPVAAQKLPSNSANRTSNVSKSSENSFRSVHSNAPVQSVIASGRNSSLKVPVFRCERSFRAHSDKIGCICELADGGLVSGGYDRFVRVWEVNSMTKLAEIKEAENIFCLLEFTPGELLVGIAGEEKNLINVWNLKTLKKIGEFAGHLLWINCLVKCDTQFFASGSNDKTIKIWDYFGRECVSTLNGHQDCVVALTMIKSGYLCSGSIDLTIRIWDWRNSTCVGILRGHEKWIKCLTGTSSGDLISGGDDKKIKIWDPKKSDQCLATLTGHGHSVRTLCEINDKLFASGSFDSTIKIWDKETLGCLQTLVGHSSNVISVIRLRNGNLASCSNDQSIRIWKAE